MKKIILLGLFAAAGFAQTSSSSTAPARRFVKFNTLPITCVAADIGYQISDTTFYKCATANTWTSFSSGGAGSPGGSNTQLQYNNSGAFGGITGATTNGTIVTLTSPVFVTPALGTPASGVATNITGLPVSTGISGLAAGIATWLATSSSANLAAALTDETGSSLAVFNTSPLLVTPKVTTITDANGNPFILSTATSSAVDSITVTNAATANPATVAVTASGSDSNINLSLIPKGTGKINIGSTNATMDTSGNLVVVGCTGCGGGSSIAQECTISLSSAQIQALGTGGNAQTCVAGVAGTWYEVNSISMKYTFVTAAYTVTGGHLGLCYDNGCNFGADTTGGDNGGFLAAVLNGGSSSIYSAAPARPVNVAFTVAPANGVGAGLFLVNWGSAFTVGSGTLIYKVTYFAHTGL